MNKKLKVENRNFGVIQGVMIALAVISIVVVVAFKIIGNQLENETANSEAYNGLVDIRTEVINAISWVGIAVVVVIGFALIYMMGVRK
jgi:Na+/proline symporter